MTHIRTLRPAGSALPRLCRGKQVQTEHLPIMAGEGSEGLETEDIGLPALIQRLVTVSE